MKEIKNFLFTNYKVETQQQFSEALEYFTTEANQTERFDLYHKYKNHKSLLNEAAAKLEILQNMFGDYICSQIDLAQEICGTNIEESDKIINQIKQIKLFFKDYDQLSFKEYLCSVIPDINIDEINAIFEKQKFTTKDAQTLSDSLKKILTSPTKKNENYSLALANHELVSLLSLSRKKSFIFKSQNFNKYKELANALIEFRKKENIEGFDGAIMYLIEYDVRIGLDKAKEPIELVNVLEKLKNQTLQTKDIFALMKVAVVESKNFEDDGFGNIKFLENSGETFRLRGVSDRCYNQSTLVHSVSSNNERQQVGRAIQLKSKNSDILPVSIMIGDTPAIPRQLKEFGVDHILTPREQLVLSYANNFSYVLTLNSESKIAEQIFSKGPIEIYTDCYKQSQRFTNEFLTYNNKIIDFIQSYINVLDKTGILSIENSTFGEDKKHIHLIRPLKTITNAVIELYENEISVPNKYQQILSNLCHFLLKNEKTILTGNMETVSDFRALFRNIKGFEKQKELLPETKIDTSFLELKYPEESYSLSDIILSEKSTHQKQEALSEYFNDNFDKLSLDTFTSEELALIREIPEDIKKAILPHLYLLAKSELDTLPYSGKGRPADPTILLPVLTTLTNQDENSRVFNAWYTPNNYSSREERKVYKLYHKDYNETAYLQIEIMETLAYLTKGKIHTYYQLKEENQARLKSRLNG